MERKDVMTKNVTIYADQASALAKHASKDVKVLVVANPANTNALILKVVYPFFLMNWYWLTGRGGRHSGRDLHTANISSNSLS